MYVPTHIGNRSFTYDLNGNQTGWESDVNGTRRHILWDEENRVSEIDDNGERNRYVYDAKGERTVKLTKQGETVYVNQYYVVRNRSVVSKHLFAGTGRVVSHLVMGTAPGNEGCGAPGNGHGSDKTPTVPESNGNSGNVKGNNGQAGNDKEKGNNGLHLGQFKNGKENPGQGRDRRSDTANLHAQDVYKNPTLTGEMPGQGSENRSEQAGTVAKNVRTSPLVISEGDASVELGGDTSGGESVEGVTETFATPVVNGQSEFIWYYHPDHLGSTGFVTDQNGELYEHVEYFPFGESWVQEHSNTQRTPYLYTGKELDEETGLYYYGARYYDPRTSVWVSADPILKKYLPTGDKEQDARLAGIGGVFNSLNIGLYTYAHLKPNKLLDPDGNSTWINENNDVEVVINDSDLSIYKLTSSNVQKVGETYFWDSFTRNGDINPSALGHINTGRDITSKLWQIADRAKTQNYIGMALDSRDGKPLDIKASIPMASKHKAQEGFLFQGKYISLRDGGNILYGINMSNQNLTRDAAMRGAGGWAQEKSMFSAAMGQLGKEYGPAPYFGEDAITGTRIDFGFSLNGGYHPPPGHLSDIAAP